MKYTYMAIGFVVIVLGGKSANPIWLLAGIVFLGLGFRSQKSENSDR